LAGAGTLGFLIPPSMMMLVYGILADVSIGKLFIAGVIPGIILAICFSGYLFLRCLSNSELAPHGDENLHLLLRVQQPKSFYYMIRIVKVTSSSTA
jgi:TRAP-type C4-dicarboxylate transport system permease large subunit